jgi:hypothetical protein
MTAEIQTEDRSLPALGNWWRSDRERFWNFWEMVQLTGDDFFRIAASFKDLALAVVFDCGPHVGLDQRMPEEARKDLSLIFTDVADRSLGIGLRATAAKCLRTVDALALDLTYGQVQDHFQHTHTTFIDEINGYQILIIDSEEVKRYLQGWKFFHPDSQIKLPGTAYDLNEAGRCYTVGLWTACAFHLMRVIEKAVRQWAGSLGIPLTFTRGGHIEDQSWNNLEQSIRSKINDLSRVTVAEIEHQRLCLRAVRAFTDLREAWRNPTMHPEKEYSEMEGKNIYATTPPGLRTKP